MEAKYIIWITEKSKQNHQKAIEWLNDNISEDIHFFLLEAEILQIDDSKLVPKFNVVIQPNNWSKTSKSIARNDNPADTENYAFWSKLCEVANNNLKLQVYWRNPTRRYCMNISIGISGGGYLRASTTYRDRKYMGQGKVGMELCISNNKDLFDHLNESGGSGFTRKRTKQKREDFLCGPI